MKKFILSAFSFLSIIVTSQTAQSKYCVQQIPDAEYDISAVYYVVQIDELKDLTQKLRKTSRFDKASEVSVKISFEREYSGYAGDFKSFNAIAMTENFNYSIQSVKKNGFKFYTNLNNTDYARMTLFNKDGSQEQINLVCN